MALKRVYWDTSCFISYLSNSHPDEADRGRICEDILNHARGDQIEIWTSVWTIVETVRPKSIYIPTALPLWSELLKSEDKDGKVIHPKAMGDLEKIWAYYKRNTLPMRHLSDGEVLKIKAMFEWPWINKI